MSTRRGFLIGIGAALAAPAIVKAESLMKIAVLRQELSERTVTELFNRLAADSAHRQMWKSIHLNLGMQITRISIDSDGLKHTIIPPEDFYARPQN